MHRPVIGVVPLVDTERDSYWMLPGYLEGVTAAGGLPVMLPLSSDRAMLTQIADAFDGFLFTGGQDVSPALYGEQLLPACGDLCQPRDSMERVLFALAWERDKPMLGICRGIQFFNAILGGTLYQDLPTQTVSSVTHQQSPPYDEPIHEVTIALHTPLHALLEQRVIPVNSCHHQAVKALAPSLSAMAYSTDGLIEAVYAPEKKYVWGVQWHPECSFATDRSSQKLLERFIAAV